MLGRLENLRVKNFDRRSCSGSLSDALPLAAQKLNELLPELRGTARAAEGWLRNNPLDPSLSIIRV